MTHLNAKPETFVAAPVGGGTWALQFETDDGEKYCVLINDVNFAGLPLDTVKLVIRSAVARKVIGLVASAN
jgi:hypothetical protein